MLWFWRSFLLFQETIFSLKSNKIPVAKLFPFLKSFRFWFELGLSREQICWNVLCFRDPFLMSLSRVYIYYNLSIFSMLHRQISITPETRNQRNQIEYWPFMVPNHRQTISNVQQNLGMYLSFSFCFISNFPKGQNR